MLKFSCIAFFLFFIFLESDAQEILIHGKITDTAGVAIPFCGIQNLRNQSGTTADASGFYSFRTKLPASIRVSAIGYNSEQKEITLKQLGDTVIVLNFRLTSSAALLQSVNITSEHLPVVVAESSSLLDFEMKSEELCLLYETRRGEKIEVADTGGNVLHKFYLHNPAQELHKTAHGFLFSLSADSAYVYQWDSISGFSEFSVPVDTFKLVALSIAAYYYPCYYYTIDTAMRTRIIYYYDNKLTGERAPLFVYTNQQMLISNIGLNENILSLAGGAGGGDGTMAGINKSLNERAIAEAHISDQIGMLQSSHCELKIIRDSVYVFNFDIDSIYVFNANNKFVRKTPMLFDLYGANYKHKKIIVDEESKECFFSYDVNGILHLDLIDLDNGERKSANSLDKFPFIEKVRISNNYAYFCYLDRSAGQEKRRIFRQQIN